MTKSRIMNALKWITKLLVALIVALFIIVILLRWFNPPITTVIISERINLNQSTVLEWTPIESLGENILLTVVASEDSNFCDHHGFDLSEILKVRNQQQAPLWPF